MIEQQKEQHTNSNQNTPLVSVGLPVYNRPELLYQALEAITTQSYKSEGFADVDITFTKQCINAILHVLYSR